MVFDHKSSGTAAAEDPGEAELRRMKDVIAEITAENLDLKKDFRAGGLRQLPPELQQQVHAVVQQTKARSRWPARRTLTVLGIPARSYYRWLREEAWATAQAAAVRPVQALEEEKAAVRAYACRHTESAETLQVIMRHKDFGTTRKFYGAKRAAQATAVEIHQKLAISERAENWSTMRSNSASSPRRKCRSSSDS